MNFDELTPEQQEKARACKSADELLALAQSEGLELSAEQLEVISGGSWNTGHACPEDYCSTAWHA